MPLFMQFVHSFICSKHGKHSKMVKAVDELGQECSVEHLQTCRTPSCTLIQENVNYFLAINLQLSPSKKVS